ncbi:EamA family transporter RarD [Candidatus Uabimicrobium amorphum]|uniref:EamA family transporter RarD n=1 Tax=Uabimicrobium amorphum TaxID=2596890 RepID=UPI001E41D47D|nr:EamA family transporter RarD [Candidatus Uabimicrobium amorphum]
MPLFWKQLAHVPAAEIIFHRMLWSFVSMGVLLTALRNWKWIALLRESPKMLLWGFLSAALIAGNWFIFIWAVNNGYIVEASLGYFINPLLSIALGIIVLKEGVRRVQIFAIIVAALGVCYLTFVYGHFPVVAFVLAATFGIYGLIRKMIPFGALSGLFVETAFMFLPAVFCLVHLESSGNGTFSDSSFSTQALLLITGVATITPLLFFAAGVRKIPLYTVGFLHYIAPTLQFLIGVFVYNEKFSFSQLVGFCFIWLAIVIFCVESYVFYKNNKAVMVGLSPATDDSA